MKRILTLILTFVFCAGLALMAQQQLRRAPGFALSDMTGQVHDLYDYRGKVVVMDLMMTTCPHCAAFADILQQVQQKYAGRVQVLSVANVPQDSPVTLKKFITDHKIGYPVLLDQGQMEYSYVLKPKVDMPQVYVIDANGYIRGDFGYSPSAHDIFEGKGIFTEIDKALAAVNSSKK